MSLDSPLIPIDFSVPYWLLCLIAHILIYSSVWFLLSFLVLLFDFSSPYWSTWLITQLSICSSICCLPSQLVILFDCFSLYCVFCLISSLYSLLFLLTSLWLLSHPAWLSLVTYIWFLSPFSWLSLVTLFVYSPLWWFIFLVVASLFVMTLVVLIFFCLTKFQYFKLIHYEFERRY